MAQLPNDPITPALPYKPAATYPVVRAIVGDRVYAGLKQGHKLMKGEISPAEPIAKALDNAGKK